MVTSKSENKLKEALASIIDFNRVKQSYRPDVLRKETTGNNLEIDIFYKFFNIGFEYQGEGHFYNLKQFNYNSDKAREHDMLKQDAIMKLYSIKKCIVEIFPSDLQGSIKENIINRMLNTQEDLFYKKHIAKCASIELFLLHCMNNISPQQFKTIKSEELLYSFATSGYLNKAAKYFTSNREGKIEILKYLKNFQFSEHSYMVNRKQLSFTELLKVLFPTKNEKIYTLFRKRLTSIGGCTP